MFEKLRVLNRTEFSAFGFVSLAWLVIAQFICSLLSSQDEFLYASQWLLGFWTISVLDLLVLKKLISSVFKLVSLSQERDLFLSAQALGWGVFKVLCLGLFIIVLLKGHKIPTHGLFLGIGTLVVIPVVGGLLWSQRILSNA
jgi:hypothetical protein